MKQTLNVTVALDDSEIADLRTLVEDLYYNQQNITDNQYMAVYKIVKEINTADEKRIAQQKIKDRLANPGPWAEVPCKWCKHKADMHAQAGKGLCCKMDCECDEFRSL